MTGFNVTGPNGNVWAKKGNIATIGFARSGKGANIILNALLHESLVEYDAPSWVILDPKGENLAVAGKYMLSSGYDVMVLNPFDIEHIRDFGKVNFNPFDLLDPKRPDFIRYVDLICNAILPPPVQDHSNSYFIHAASDLLSLYITHMMTQDREPKNIETLYRWLRLAGDKRDRLFVEMEKNTFQDVSEDAQAVFTQLNAQGARSIYDVYANAVVATKSFRDPLIRECMAESDFSIRELSHEKKALFVCVAPDDLRRMAPWMRIIMACIMRGLTRHFNPNRKVVMLMDEFFQMGRLDEFANGMSYVPGMNITLWPVVQDLNQLKSLYPDEWETFIGNAAIKHWMVRDNFSAEYLSKIMPKTILFLGNNADGSPRYDQKPIMEPSDIVTSQDIIMQIDGVEKPIKVPKKPYYMKYKHFSPNPYFFGA